VVPWNPKNQKKRSSLLPTWTKEELGKRTSIERFFSRVFLFFGLQRPPFSDWFAIHTARLDLYGFYHSRFSRLARGLA
jgi:hypothetical protein